jgi:hypothetical protein
MCVCECVCLYVCVFVCTIELCPQLVPLRCVGFSWVLYDMSSLCMQRACVCECVCLCVCVCAIEQTQSVVSAQ